MKTVSKKFFASAAVLALALIGRSQPAPVKYDWADLAKDGKIHYGIVITVDGREALKIENTNDAPLRVRLMTVEHPAITAQVYQLSGEVRYDSVQGDGFLEMWNVFPPLKPGLPEGQYFSRTLAGPGPMRMISGTSGWREFALLFNSAGASGAPTRLELYLILSGHGTVYLGLPMLTQLPGAKSAGDALYPNAWWSDRTAASVGGWGGGIFGTLGALVGLLAMMKRARGFIIFTLGSMTVMGVGLLIAGLVAVGQHQPYGVWYPLILGGILMSTICPANLFVFARRNQAEELRRMQALDASA